MIDFFTNHSPSLALLCLPFVSALIGWVTNYIAIKLLFHPREPLCVGPFSLQGILPRRQADIAVQLGRIVARDLLSSEYLIQHLTNDKSRELYRELIDREAEKFIRKRLYPSVPLSRLFLRSRTIADLKSMMVDELLASLPELIETLADPDQGALDIQQLVEDRVRSFSTRRLEELLQAVLAKEFRFIELLGALLGFIIGTLQMLWILFLL